MIYINLLCSHAHQGGLVIAMQDVDEICNSQHTCAGKGFTFMISHSDKLFTTPTTLIKSYPQISVTCCPIKAQLSSHLPPVQKRPFPPLGVMNSHSEPKENQISARETACMNLL